MRSQLEDKGDKEDKEDKKTTYHLPPGERKKGWGNNQQADARTRGRGDAEN
ncbi:MAG: hypothetical protein F6K41_33740 [Symploca sp. SIO3E6]|nr:hypothetical protein [Caldora sp. SIO3E6]